MYSQDERLCDNVVMAMRAFKPFLKPGGRVRQQSHVSPSLAFYEFSKRFLSMPSSRNSSSAYASASERANVTPWPQPSLVHGIGDETSPAIKNQRKRIAYIALGSNLGDRIVMIERACNEMSARGIKIMRTSSLWETEPMYVLDQNKFLNGACEVETTLEPMALLNELQDIEKSMGREKVIDKGPRNIDLDILLYEDRVIDHHRLKVPHPSIAEREFVLRPLAELIPNQPLHPKSPWKIAQDYLNALPHSETAISTLTPLTRSSAPLYALKAGRPTHVMAILNVTPDSFSDGGSHSSGSLSDTISGFIEAGATIIDVGGQSSAPGAAEVSATEEMARILPAIEVIRRHPRSELIAVSVDTYRASVAEAAIKAGADIVNDVSGGTLDSQMLSTVARLGKTISLMHMRGTPTTMTKMTDYAPAGLIPTVAQELLRRIAAAEEAGIRRWRIILDPGIGFAKSSKQNLAILKGIEVLRDWPGLRGLPWLLGSSRKKFIGQVTGVETPKERVWGTAATVAAAVQGGADIVRVHDVVAMTQVVKMSDAIWRTDIS